MYLYSSYIYRKINGNDQTEHGKIVYVSEHKTFFFLNVE